MIEIVDDPLVFLIQSDVLEHLEEAFVANSHDCRCTNAILGEYVRSLSLSFGGTGPTTGCSFIRFVDGAVRFIRLPGVGGG